MLTTLVPNGATKIGNAVIPPEGPLAIPLQMNFAAQTMYSVNVQSLMQKGPGFPGLSVIQCLFVDNSGSQTATNVLITGTQQNIIVPPGAQGYFPILSPSIGQIVFSNSAGGTVNADIINVPMPAMIWGGAGGASPQFDEDGRLIVSDPALEALIADAALSVRGYDGPIPEAPEDGNTYGRKNGAWAVAGGGGGGGGSISPYVPGALIAPVAADFTVNAQAGFAGAAVTGLNSGRGVEFGFPTTAGFQACQYELNDFTPPAAGTDFSVTALVSCNSQLDASWHFGLYVQDSAGNYSAYGLRNNLYSNFNYSGIGNVAGQNNTNTCQNVQGPWWYRIQREAAQLVVSMSQDGETFMETFSVSSTAFLGADLTNVGFSAGWNSGGPQSFSCFSFYTSEP